MNPLRGMRPLLACFALVVSSSRATAGEFNVRDFGATGDGLTLDTDAINRTMAAAAKAGGGAVVFPAGTYLSFSIHLQSNLSLTLGPGARLVAAEPPASGKIGYDAAEENDEGEFYQDFGHAHWHNSLIWGENLENVTIAGPGTIDGHGLSQGKGSHVRDLSPEEQAAGKGNASPQFQPVVLDQKRPTRFRRNPKEILPAGLGNKAIALKNCRNIVLRDFTIRHGGHFGILATGVDNLLVHNLTIDTNRDGMDLDACRNLRVTDCVVNSPFDDAIVLKSSYALNALRACEDVTISGCQVSGFVEGSLLDGRRRRFAAGGKAPNFGPCGRIKCGTESNGGFKNIAISNCVFDYCRGLAFEVVDGGALEDVVVSNLTMRDIVNPPIYVRLGNRGRGPEGTGVGTLRRLHISQVIVYAPQSTSGILIDGLAGHPIEDLSLRDITIVYQGGGTEEQGTRLVPEMEKTYPEPARWGVLPAWGIWARHVKNLQVENLELRLAGPDHRAAVTIADGDGVRLEKISTPMELAGPRLVFKDTRGLAVHEMTGLSDLPKNLPLAGQF